MLNWLVMAVKEVTFNERGVKKYKCRIGYRYSNGIDEDYVTDVNGKYLGQFDRGLCREFPEYHCEVKRLDSLD